MRELIASSDDFMDPRVTELHCIMPIGNVPSVLEHGILSHVRAARLRHHSVALQPVQDNRDVKSVPQGLKLHQYANLYFHARNPMMYRRKEEAPNLCVLRVSTAVLEQAGAVVTDCNAASTYVRFLAPSQWKCLDIEDIYARVWTHPESEAREFQHKSRKCAEVLVPERVEPRFLVGAYVVDTEAADRLRGLEVDLPIEINPVLCFRE